MSRLKVILLLSLAVFLSCQEVQEQPEWLIGQWLEVIDQDHGEIWIKTDTGLFGRGYTIENSDTSYFEKHYIVGERGSLVLKADVDENAEVVSFNLIEYNSRSLTFENPQHDFPKKIQYQLIHPDTLMATISDEMRSFQFEFTRQ